MSMITDIKAELANVDDRWRFVHIPTEWLVALVEYYDTTEARLAHLGMIRDSGFNRLQAARKKLEE